MKEITIQKKLIATKNNNWVHIKFYGIADDDFDISSIEEFLNKNPNIAIKRLKDIVQMIRTIFRNVKENYLSIILHDKNFNEGIIYENGIITYYDKNVYGSKGYEVSYTIGVGEGSLNGFLFEYKDKKNYGKKNCESPQSNLINTLNDINKYSNINPVILNDNAKHLIEIYYYFFNETPNFADPSINNRIQAMMGILYCLGIYTDYDFSVGKMVKPYSIELSTVVSDLFSYGEINMEDIFGPDNSSIAIKDLIVKISNRIYALMENIDDKDKALAKLASYLYVKKYCVFEEAKTSDIAALAKVSEAEIEIYDQFRNEVEVDKLTLEF